jgi:hypothetical protein
MTADELIALYRREMRDTALPYLVEDEDLYTYLADAQKWFCRLTDGIEDSRTDKVTLLPLLIGTDWYELSPLVLKVRAVRSATTGETVRIVEDEDTEFEGIRFDGLTGPIRVLVTGRDRNAVRAWPIPSVAESLRLTVFRLPLRDPREGYPKLEIREEHHLALLDWMKHKVYSIPDAELYDRNRASEHEAKFRAYCAESKKEQGRLRHTAGTVRYGGL